jgi:hypothetical protein
MPLPKPAEGPTGELSDLDDWPDASGKAEPSGRWRTMSANAVSKNVVLVHATDW